MDVHETSAAHENSALEATAHPSQTTSLHDIAELFPEDDKSPTVKHQAWLKNDDYWQRSTYIALTGRQTAAPHQTRPIPRPERFQKQSTLRSLTILGLTLALIVFIPIGVIVANNLGATHLKMPTSLPGLAQPTTTPVSTHTVTATPTPKKK